MSDFTSNKHSGYGETADVLKARFLALFIVTLFLITLVTITVSIHLSQFPATIIVQCAAALVMLAAFRFLASGRYRLAFHTILIAGFTSLWTVFFLDVNGSPITRIDSVVLVTGLSSSMAIPFFKTRKPIVAYFSLNALLLLAFNFHIKSQGILSAAEHLDYLCDNAIAICFVFLVAFSAFSINQQALIYLKKELAERKKAEKALLESRNLLSGHLEQTPVGAIFWDLDFKVTGWNPAAEAIFGYTRTEAMGRHGCDLIVPETARATVEQVFAKLITDQGGIRSVNENTTKSDSRILCEWYNSVLKDSEGRIIGAASLVNDITEKTRIQELLIQSEKMMSVGGLAAGMAHEINNPLSGMIQSAQIITSRLTRDIKANLTAAEASGTSMAAIRSYAEKRDILKALDTIRDAGQRTIDIIENMLSFSKIGDQERHPVDLETVIESTVDLAGNDHTLKRAYQFRRLDIHREFDPDIPVVFGERTKLQQVVFNLIKNALDAMNLKTYEDEVPRLTLRLKKGDGHVHIEVEDNGPGMPEDTCQKIFTPFFTTKREKGTGLGLSISRFIIEENHGGQMTVDSRPGEGTRFTVKLPIRQGKKKTS